MSLTNIDIMGWFILFSLDDTDQLSGRYFPHLEVFHRLIANKTPSSENFIFQMWLPSPCSSSGKSRSRSRQVPPMEAGRWATRWMIHRATEHDSPERRWVLSYHERILHSWLDHVWKTGCDFSLILWPGHARILVKGRWSNNRLTRCSRECLRRATK